MITREFNFDGLIGPTHNYAGLSYGNIASASHRNRTSYPRDAALQGLEKMRTLASLGVGQCLLPPLRRPRTELLRELGFVGKTPAELIQSASKTAPHLVAAVYSAASMWTANAATVSPSSDCQDGRLHLSAANLASTLHRSLERDATFKNLTAIFCNDSQFVVHKPLPSSVALADEGAANHTRLGESCGEQGIEIFVFGYDCFESTSAQPKIFPSRQSRLASESIIRLHRLDPDATLLWQQNPLAIDAGVFHNDVISVGNQNVLLLHELAYVDQAEKISKLRRLYEQRYEAPLFVIEFSNGEMSLSDAVKSYFFNSQLVTRPDAGMTLVCPIECQEIEAAQRCAERVVAETNPVDDVRFLDLRQSMNNGGGPACLRLRIVMTETQQAAIHPGVVFNEPLAGRVETWIQRHYRETLDQHDLNDPQLILESEQALDALGQILNMELA